MLDSSRDGSNEWDRMTGADYGAFDSGAGTRADGGATELEPGWRAVRALMQVRSDQLLSVMMRPSFRPVRELDLVPLAPCGICLDGGLRTAGSVRTRKGREHVRACDTCGAVVIGTTVEAAAEQ